jgi:transposase
MGRKILLDKKEQERARKMAKEATGLEDLRMAQSILLPDERKSLGQAAEQMGVSRRTVIRLRKRFRQGTEAQAETGQWGGRRRELLSLEAEKAFLGGWEHQARTGNMLIAGPMREALCRKLGKQVSEATIYRMLARHGWRKVAPDTRHPKADRQAQQEWKKNSRKSWRIRLLPKKPKINPYA